VRGPGAAAVATGPHRFVVGVMFPAAGVIALSCLNRRHESVSAAPYQTKALNPRDGFRRQILDLYVPS